ncbi:MAG: GntR family transcriptional regulator [Spirochaetales bacterium]|nr:GntR family transcriptional regulator [Spirochaetales bacterium]
MEIQIRDRLIEEILNGTYGWGEKLPSENRLSEEYQVPRITVRKVLVTLEDMGYIYSRQGQGRFLRERQEKIPLNLTGEVSFTDKLKESGFDLETSTVGNREISPSPKMRRVLQAGTEELICRIERLRIVNGKPIAIHISYLKESLFPDIGERADQIESLFAYFREKGYTGFCSSKTNMSISLPTMDEQNLLACPPLVPLLVMEADTKCSDTGQVIQYTRILYRSDVFQYEVNSL